jgi:hypothetical protein
MKLLPHWLLAACASIMTWITSPSTHAGVLDCVPANGAPLAVRIGATSNEPRPALLLGGTAPALRIVDAVTHTELWSAGAAGAVTQRFSAMTASFHNATAVDINGDGVHDRIYAGDLAGRVWRIDLHHGQAADHWATGGIFADLADPIAARAFVAAPDVSLGTQAGRPPWLNIAIGSASLQATGSSNRLYILRDLNAFTTWPQVAFNRWQPLHETALARVAAGATSLAEPELGASAAGLFVELGEGQILTPSLTINGHVVLAVAEGTPTRAAQCATPVSIGTMDLRHGRPVLDLNADGAVDRRDARFGLPASLPADAAFSLATTTTGAAHARAGCQLGATPIPACSIDTSYQRNYWRREDAD